MTGKEINGLLAQGGRNGSTTREKYEEKFEYIENLNNGEPEPETNVTPGNSNPEVTEGSGEDANPFFGAIQGAATDPNKDASDIDQCEESKASEKRLESDFGGNSEVDTILSGGESNVAEGSAECNPSTGEDSEGSSEDCVNPNNVPTTTDNAVGGDDGEEDKVGADYGDAIAAAEADKKAKDSERARNVNVTRNDLGTLDYNRLTGAGMTQDEVIKLVQTRGVGAAEGLIRDANQIFFSNYGQGDFTRWKAGCDNIAKIVQPEIRNRSNDSFACENHYRTKAWEESLKQAIKNKGWAGKTSDMLYNYANRSPRGGNSTVKSAIQNRGTGVIRQNLDVNNRDALTFRGGKRADAQGIADVYGNF